MYVDYDPDLLDIGLIEPELRWETKGLCNNCTPELPKYSDYVEVNTFGEATAIKILISPARMMYPCNPPHSFPKILWKTTMDELAPPYNPDLYAIGYFNGLGYPKTRRGTRASGPK